MTPIPDTPPEAPRPAPYRIRLEPSIEGLTVIESSDTGWQAWDSAMVKLDGIYGAHE